MQQKEYSSIKLTDKSEQKLLLRIYTHKNCMLMWRVFEAEFPRRTKHRHQVGSTTLQVFKVSKVSRKMSCTSFNLLPAPSFLINKDRKAGSRPNTGSCFLKLCKIFRRLGHQALVLTPQSKAVSILAERKGVSGCVLYASGDLK